MGEIMTFALTAALACVYTELVGYLLHRLLHAGRIAWMTRRHLVHHLELYGPTMKLRTPVYRDRELHDGIAGVGWEWIVPSVVLFVVELLTLVTLGVAPSLLVTFFGVGLVWSVVMFHAAHEAMHVTRPTLFLAGPWRDRFLVARRMHDIHHVAIDEQGRFIGNFGMLCFGFDRVFGTYLRKVPVTGKRSAKRRDPRS